MIRSYFRKKGKHLIRGKRAHLLVLKVKRAHFLFSRDTFFHATLMLMDETPKIGPDDGS